ncbi:4-hydroxy-tetrahydrodipicolinate synthase [Paradevosia shaoguanensis]|jgi:4-hydroxy-tetrahydrodipicolinate synthase|uniref:4-hydroxy-tetrahydrodipicolinate synthase n=1 Tax=Paradevosia shaoguanensis TaxID=1335043 RepID=UPI000455CC1E|nr:dihydrodipicolinate synthase [Devosia sp. 17-2-E-8]MBI4046477.1 4-hydroxy-tetrahydrodipicolinate synthase [Devosia nanyangense]QMV02364.1 4-hydroxy-tetrahydrodipicolinate synthase [Devosia sp. D6-9]CDP50734.1 Dihydrodipicolinate synthase [Devosia sp. DBB001]
MLRGSITALITPFANGAVDEKAFSAFVDWQIAEGSHGLVPVGTTGESPTVSHEEHRRIIEICVEVANKRVPILAGAGANSTAEAVALARYAEEVGADAVLSVVPYYNKPNQEGLFQHFSAVANATALPIILYSVPGRTVVDLTVDTIARLRDAHDNIIGVKDATSDMGRATAQRAKLGKDFILLSGEDMTALGFNAHGGTGCISVTSNIAPKLCAEFQNACQQGNYARALELQDKLAPLHRTLFLEPNPTGVKYAANKLGLAQNELRLPLVPISPATQQAIDGALAHAGLI